MGLDRADTHTPGWFTLRTKVSKNIILAMTEDEKKVLEDESDLMEKEGLPQEQYLTLPHRLFRSTLDST